VRRGGSEWLRVARAGWARVGRERKRGWGWARGGWARGGSGWLGSGWVGVAGGGWRWLGTESREQRVRRERADGVKWSRAHSRVLENGLRKNFP
jgi:hypothetical protein